MRSRLFSPPVSAQNIKSVNDTQNEKHINHRTKKATGEDGNTKYTAVKKKEKRKIYFYTHHSDRAVPSASNLSHGTKR